MRFLGIDYGARRIGLAISDPTGLLARPLKMLALAHHGNQNEAVTLLMAEIADLASEDDGLAGIVIGLPRKLGGEPTDQTAAVQAIAETLRQRIDVPLVLQDERLSSREAERMLAERIKDWRARKPLLDAQSAAVILQDFLDSRAVVSHDRLEDRPS